MKDKLIEKLKEMISYLRSERWHCETDHEKYLIKEIAALEKQIEEQEDKENDIPPISFNRDPKFYLQSIEEQKLSSDLREKLVKYQIWVNNFQNEYGRQNTIQLVNEYLKTK